MAGIDESRQFVPLKIAVLTISDTREDADDKSGATLVERIRAAGHAVAARTIVKDPRSRRSATRSKPGLPTALSTSSSPRAALDLPAAM